MTVLPTDRGYVEVRDSARRPGEVEVRVYAEMVDGQPSGLFAVHDSVPRGAIRMRGRAVRKGSRSLSTSVCAVYWNADDRVLEITPGSAPSASQPLLENTH